MARRNRTVAAQSNGSLRFWLALNWANKVLAAAYIGVACVVGYQVGQQSVSLSGGLVVILLALILALGHFMCKEWALKTSAAIFSVVALLAIPYLFSTYEQELVPSQYVRVVKFVLVVLWALAMLANYLSYKRLEKTGRLGK